jgi:hypothetical protein
MGFAAATVTGFGLFTLGLFVLGLYLDFTSMAAIVSAAFGIWGIMFSAIEIHRTGDLGDDDHPNKQA